MKQHKRPIFSVIIILLLLIISCRKPTPEIGKVPEIEWMKTYSGYASLIQQTSDGGYIIVGPRGFSGKGYDIYILRTDSHGDSLWAKNYGDENSQHCTSIRHTLDGGYLITGYTLGINKYSSYYTKIDSIGNILLTKNYEGKLFSVQQTIDGGYIIAGRKGDFDVFLRINADFDTMWMKKYKIKKDYDNYLLQQTSDSGYIIVGSSIDDVFLKKTEVDGSTLWLKHYDTWGNNYINSLQQTPDSGYLTVGYIRSAWPSCNIFLIRTNKLGIKLWMKEYDVGGVDIGYSVCQTSDGGYAIAGTGESFGSRYFIIPKFLEYPIMMMGAKWLFFSDFLKLIGIGFWTDIHLLKTKPNGEILWLKKIEKVNISSICNYLWLACSLLPPRFWEHFSLQLTSDGGYIIAGFAERDGDTQKFYLIKLKPEK